MKKPHRFAEGTAVPVEKTRGEIESLLIKHGANGFLSAWQDRSAVIQFRLNGRMLRYAIEIPDPAEFKRNATHSWKVNSAERCQVYADAEHRRRWRALLLILKAKLEIVASGDSSFDREFLADIMLPQGGTVGEKLVPQMPRLLGPGGRD